MEFNFVPDMPELTFSMFIAPYRAHLMGFYIVVTPPPPCPWTINCPIGRFLLAIKQCRIYSRDTPPPPPSLLPPPSSKKAWFISYVGWNKCRIFGGFCFFFFLFFFSFYEVREIERAKIDYGFDSTKTSCMFVFQSVFWF